MTKLKVGDIAPWFEGTDYQGNTIKLSDFKGHKLILYFYPKDNTPGCTAEACSFRDEYQKLLDMGYKLVGVSPDTAESHRKFTEKYQLPFPLIADTEKEIVRKYNAWGEKKLYGKTYEGVLRKTYVISEDGKIEKIIEKVKTKDPVSQILD